MSKVNINNIDVIIKIIPKTLDKFLERYTTSNTHYLEFEPDFVEYYAPLVDAFRKSKKFYPCAKDYQDLENHVVISAHDNVEVKYALSKYLGTNFYFCPEGCSMLEDWIFYDLEKNHE